MAGYAGLGNLDLFGTTKTGNAMNDAIASTSTGKQNNFGQVLTNNDPKAVNPSTGLYDSAKSALFGNDYGLAGNKILYTDPATGQQMATGELDSATIDYFRNNPDSLKGLSQNSGGLFSTENLSNISTGVGAATGIYDLGRNMGLWSNAEDRQNKTLRDQQIAANAASQNRHDAYLASLSAFGNKG